MFVSTLHAQDPGRILGSWTNEDSSQVIKIEKLGDVYVGQLVELRGTTNNMVLDTENPDVEKRNRKLLGSDVWLNFVYDNDRDYWKDGEIYNFKNGNTYNGKIRVAGDELTLTGHYGFFFFLSKNQDWIRIKQ